MKTIKELEKEVGKYKEGYRKKNFWIYESGTGKNKGKEYTYWEPELNDTQDLFETVIWYNGLINQLEEMIELEPNISHITYDYYDKYFCNEETRDLEVYYQIQVLWMMLVGMFGDYGTSPRFGWIEDIEGYRNFLIDIWNSIKCNDQDFAEKFLENFEIINNEKGE